MSSDEPEEALATSAVAGDQEQPLVQETRADFESWVRPHLADMARLASRLGVVQARDDLVQDALTRAWRRRETYDAERGTPRTWLLAIVAGEARRGWRRRLRPQPVFEEWVADGAEDVDRRIDVERAIAALPPRQRLAVALHYFVDLRVEDCASVMGCAPGTVKWLLHEARTRLQPLVED